MIRKSSVFVPAFHFIRTLGSVPEMDPYEQRKLQVFNQLNAIGMLSGLVIPLLGLFNGQQLPLIAYVVAFSPLYISLLVLYFNYIKRQEQARLLYFTLYPVITSLVYARGLNVGLELFFILYGVLGIFYMQRLANGVLAFGISALCYLFIYVLPSQQSFSYQLKAASPLFYLLLHLIALTFIFIALFWLKKENNQYQADLLRNNELLQQKNVQIESQKNLIEQKADELAELNSVKNKLFSVIAHDLKSPMYALRNLFRQVDKFDMPAEELKEMVPDILSDLNYTTSLMENLLQWAKSQMQADKVDLQQLDVTELLQETANLLRLQAEAKKIHLDIILQKPLYVYADRDMLQLVMRNLVSNAIKFTPEEGVVQMNVADLDDFVEVSVCDTGVGMTSEVLAKLSDNSFYTTKGTSNETGTGLGLMLCKEFLKKIGSRMYIESEQGKGSVFSFTLSKCA